MRDDNGKLVFPQLIQFFKAFLTLYYGNVGPEQGFSINKAILDAHETRLGENNIIALRKIKHHLLQVSGVKNFEITRPLLESVKQSRKRYEEQKTIRKKKQESDPKEERDA